MRCLLLCFSFFLTMSCFAQIDVPEFGVFRQEETNYKECAFDKGADAVIFFDKASSNYNDEYNLVTERHVRMKILKEKGVERGNIHIYFYSGDDFEFIRDIDAQVLSFDDQNRQVIGNLEHKSIFTKKINAYYSEITFALPKVKVGSIIDYKYTSIKKHYGGLKNWIFQDEIPVILSTYQVSIIPNAEFAYNIKKSSFLPIEVKPDPTHGMITFTMRNIPGLRDEAYMAAANDYLQKVVFQLSGFTDYYGKKKYTTTWNELTKELLEERTFGAQLKKTIPNTEQLKLQCEQSTSLIEKMNVIYNYIHKTMSWDHINDIYTESVKDTWEKKKGSSGDINLLLINLLKSNGLEVYPLLVSERDHGKIDTTYPFREQFNKVAALVVIDGKNYILDGTDDNTPAGIIPYDFLNTKGYIVDKKKGGFIMITDDHKERNMINLMGDISASGEVRGEASVYNYDYARILKKQEYDNDPDKIKEAYLKNHTSLKIDSLSLSNVDKDSLPLAEKFRMSNALSKSGNYYLLNCNLFTGLEKNPFVAENRFSNIDFGCLQSSVLNEYFTLPAGLSVESLPQNSIMRTPDNSMSLSRIIENKDNTIRVQIKIEIQKTEFTIDEYSMVQQFYSKMIDQLNEPVVLKTK